MASNRQAAQAGYYELISFKIRPIDNAPGSGIELNQIVTGWNLNESMFRTNINGSANVVDAEGIFRSLPIIGEEIITVQWKDYWTFKGKIQEW